MQIKRNLVVLDLETTGTWVDKDRIIEIALIRCAPDGSIEKYDQRVNPSMPIPPVVSELTGITNADVQNSPSFKDIAADVAAFIGDSDFGGFNIDRFDLPLLEREMNEAGLSLELSKRKTYDAQKAYHLNEKRDLTAAYKFYCQKDLTNAHSAMADTEATLEILQAQVAKYAEEDEGLDVFKNFEYKKTAEFYDDERKFRWWNGKLYMMFGKYARKYSLQDMVNKDRGYCEWILSANFSKEIKELISDAINGKYPDQG